MQSRSFRLSGQQRQANWHVRCTKKGRERYVGLSSTMPHFDTITSFTSKATTEMMSTQTTPTTVGVTKTSHVSLTSTASSSTTNQSDGNVECLLMVPTCSPILCQCHLLQVSPLIMHITETPRLCSVLFTELHAH